MSIFELGLALVAGIASFLSPCCLPMVPMYLSYLGGIAGRSTSHPVLQPAGGGAVAVAAPSRWLILLHASAFVAGFSVVFVALGASASMLGVFFHLHRLFLRHAAGALIVLFGLHTAGLLRLSWLYRERRAHVDPTAGVGLGRSGLLGMFVSAVCTEECPLVGKGLSQTYHDLGQAARRLAIVAISVAPEIDTPQAIRHFAALAGWQGTDWHYLSAPRAVLAPIWKAYGVYVGPPPKPGQDPDHYAGLYLIDPRGKLRAYYDVPFLAPRVAASTRALLTT
jgi:Cytochrome C biogenesis protein transmembrane region/SCO1/SenC